MNKRRVTFFVACALVAILSTSANATITQGDFSIFGFVQSKESGRWGEGGAKDGTGRPAIFARLRTPTVNGAAFVKPGLAATESGGSFDFNRWDLVQTRQIADVRPDYHIVKNYKLLGRLDTLVLKDARLLRVLSSLVRRDRHSGEQEGALSPIATGRTTRSASCRNITSAMTCGNIMRQLNFTDNFSMRIGKQQVIWSEADALSGTEITNPSDLTFHWNHFETPENLRKNVRMIKFNYILPDYLKTANNELEAFVIPGDYEGDTNVVELNDARSPWMFPGAQGPGTMYNRFGQPFRQQTFLDQGQFPSTNFFGFLSQFHAISKTNDPSNSIENSEFGARYSTLLPIGNGLQASLIYLYEARQSKNGLCSACLTPRGFGFLIPGLFFGQGLLDYGPPPPGAPLPAGTLRVLTSTNIRRNTSSVLQAPTTKKS